MAPVGTMAWPSRRVRQTTAVGQRPQQAWGQGPHVPGPAAGAAAAWSLALWAWPQFPPLSLGVAFCPVWGQLGKKRLHLPSGRAFCVSVQASAGQPRWSSWDGALGVREGQQAECTPTQPPLFRCGPALIPPPSPLRPGLG